MSPTPLANSRAHIALTAFLLAPVLCAAAAEPAATLRRATALTMYVTLDHVVNDPNDPVHRRVGDVDKIRLSFDASAVDPKTHRVQLLDFQHIVDSKLAAPVAAPMPIADSWLDLSRKPYRLHYRASVVHGAPIIIDVDENTRRLAVHPQSDPTAVIIAGPYRIDTHPHDVR